MSTFPNERRDREKKKYVVAAAVPTNLTANLNQQRHFLLSLGAANVARQWQHRFFGLHTYFLHRFIYEQIIQICIKIIAVIVVYS